MRSTAARVHSYIVLTPPSDEILTELLEQYAPFKPAPLAPEISVFQGRSLVEVWEAAEKIAGENLPAPFWAYPWAAGCGLARVLLDNPEYVRGKRVLDLGAGGGIVSIAAKCAGATEVVANDVDPWAMAVMRLAAERQNVELAYLQEDLTERISAVDDFDVVLCSDMAYEKRMAPRYAALLQRAKNREAVVLVADAGRTYFEAADLTLLAEFTLNVPKDLEGVAVRVARVYGM
jgi:predicted nicotinamide N-methyase